MLDMVCGLSALEAAIQRRTGQLRRRADRLTGVNSTGFTLIQTSHSPQCFKNRWLTLIYHTHTHTIMFTFRRTHMHSARTLRGMNVYKDKLEHVGVDKHVEAWRHSNWCVTCGSSVWVRSRAQVQRGELHLYQQGHTHTFKAAHTYKHITSLKKITFYTH